MLEIAEYCCFDVKCTKLVHEFGAAKKQLFHNDRSESPLKARHQTPQFGYEEKKARGEEK